MNIILKQFLIFLPVIYSLIKYPDDKLFYLISILLWSVLCVINYIINNKTYFHYLWQSGICLIFLDWTFHDIQFALFLHCFTLIDYRIFGMIIVLTIFSVYIRALKWKYLLEHIKPVKVKVLFDTTLIGNMLNSIFPARLGEIYRAYLLGVSENISKSTVLATVVVERIFDGLVVGSGILYIFLLNIINSKIFFYTGLLGIGFYVMAVILLVLFYFYKEIFITIAGFFLKFFPVKVREKVLSWLNMFYEGLHIFNNFKTFCIFIFFSFLTWFIIVYYQLLYIHSMDIFAAFPFTVSPFLFALLLTGIIVIGITIPSGPGGLGPMQKFIFFAFTFVLPQFKQNLSEYQFNLIASFSIYIWLTQMLIFTAGGIFVMIKEKISLNIKFT